MKRLILFIHGFFVSTVFTVFIISTVVTILTISTIFIPSAYADNIRVKFLYYLLFPNIPHIHVDVYKLNEKGEEIEANKLSIGNKVALPKYTPKKLNKNERSAISVVSFEFDGDYKQILKKWQEEFHNLASKFTNGNANCASATYFVAEKILNININKKREKIFGMFSFPFYQLPMPGNAFNDIRDSLKNMNKNKDSSTKIRNFTCQNIRPLSLLKFGLKTSTLTPIVCGAIGCGCVMKAGIELDNARNDDCRTMTKNGIYDSIHNFSINILQTISDSVFHADV
ncbi:MAG: hypothetical protein HQK49_05670 [Oligoflexia bacterium]|nr:hypothetical protein [Oligoflexia bacterium]